MSRLCLKCHTWSKCMEPANCRKSGLPDKPQSEDLEAFQDAMPWWCDAPAMIVVAILLGVAFAAISRVM